MKQKCPSFQKNFLENSHGTVAISPIKDNNCFFTCSANIIDEKWEKPAFFKNWETRFSKNLQLWKHQHFQNWRFSHSFSGSQCQELSKTLNLHISSRMIQLQSQFPQPAFPRSSLRQFQHKHLPPHNNPQAFLQGTLLLSKILPDPVWTW